MRNLLIRAGGAVVLTTALFACGTDQPLAPSTSEALADSVAPSSQFVMEDGIMFYNYLGSAVPFQSSNPAKILLPYTRVVASCDDVGCDIKIEVNQSGYWHYMRQNLKYTVKSPSLDKVIVENSVTFTASECQNGFFFCIWKHAQNEISLGRFDYCDIEVQASTLHEAGWGAKASLSYGRVTVASMTFGVVYAQSQQGFARNICIPPEEPPPYAEQCEVCQQWFWYEDGKIVDEWWDCYEANPKACSGTETV